MKFILLGLMFALGVGVTLLLMHYSDVVGPVAAQVAIGGPKLNISYADFIAIMLTCVTVVLGAVAIRIGIVAFRTVKEMKEDARIVVREELKKEMDVQIANYQKDRVMPSRA